MIPALIPAFSHINPVSTIIFVLAGRRIGKNPTQIVDLNSSEIPDAYDIDTQSGREQRGNKAAKRG